MSSSSSTLFLVAAKRKKQLISVRFNSYGTLIRVSLQLNINIGIHFPRRFVLKIKSSTSSRNACVVSRLQYLDVQYSVAFTCALSGFRWRQLGAGHAGESTHTLHIVLQLLLFQLCQLCQQLILRKHTTQVCCHVHFCNTRNSLGGVILKCIFKNIRSKQSGGWIQW